MTDHKHLDEEANNFALEMLLPKDDFEKYVENESCCAGDIAQHFQVTRNVVMKRAAQLGYKPSLPNATV